MHFVTIEQLAARIGLPCKWLQTEADEGRIPVLHIGRGQRFHLETVVKVLVRRSMSGIPPLDDEIDIKDFEKARQQHNAEIDDLLRLMCPNPTQTSQ